MKGKLMLGFLLFLIMFAVPFLSIGAKDTDKTETAPSSQEQSAPPPVSRLSSAPAANAASVFRIQDTSSGKIITVGDRDFLYGAIVTEMSPEAPPEALKAQGVAAYTYYSRQREKQRQSTSSTAGADFTADTQNWQIYVTKEQMQARWGDNFNTYYQKLTSVVDAIYGQVLKSNGELIDATYYAISSGKTETSEDIWGGKRSYLISVASPGDVFAGGYQTTVVLDENKFKAAAQKASPKVSFSSAASAWIGEIKRTASGSVETIVIGGTKITGNDARSAFGLRSANFTVSYAGGNFTFVVKGYGHGVGMSQTGAEYMANQGSTYRQILAWYYPTTTLTTINPA
jgi:stage II sporulation protein D